jgi:feruloyl esterase
MEHGINGIPDPFPLLVNWREHGVSPGVIRLHRQYAEETVDIPLYPYPGKTGYKTGIGFFPEQGARGVLPVAGRFLPAARE